MNDFRCSPRVAPASATSSQQLYSFDTVLFVPATNPYAAAVNPYPDVPYVLVGYNFLNDFGPIALSSSARVYGGTLGLKASIGESWRLTLSGSYGREATRYSVYNQPDSVGARMQHCRTRIRATAFNPFGTGSQQSGDDRRDPPRSRATCSVDVSRRRLSSPMAR